MRWALAIAVIGCSSQTDAPPAPAPAPQTPTQPRPVSAPDPEPAPATPEPAPDAQLPADAFVDPIALDPTIALDVRYATDRNFTGEPVYPVARCLLRRAVADALLAASEAVRAEGFRLKVWDCYRPFSVQERLWAKVSDPRYVARPVRDDAGAPFKGSKHNRGAAVDLTLIAGDGSELELPTDYDDFSRAAHRDSPSRSAAARRHAAILDRAMTGAGFTGIATEWWHYDGPGWKRYPLSDQPLH